MQAQDLKTWRDRAELRLPPSQIVGLGCIVRVRRFLSSDREPSQLLSTSSLAKYCLLMQFKRCSPRLRLASPAEPDTESSRTAIWPIRLCEWRLVLDNTTFSYGDDEVELPIWDFEIAFALKQQAPSLPAPQPDGNAVPSRRGFGNPRSVRVPSLTAWITKWLTFDRICEIHRGLIHDTYHKSILGGHYVYHGEETEMLTILSRHDQELLFQVRE